MNAMRKISFKVTFCIFFVFALGCSQKESVDLVIKDVKLFDGTSITENATVSVKNGLIFRIETGDTADHYSSKYVVDGSHKTLVPGLINAHCHINKTEDLKESARAGILTVIELLQIYEDSIPKFRALSKLKDYPYYFTSGIGADMPDAVIKTYIQRLNPYAPRNKEEISQFMKDRLDHKVDFIKIFQDSRLPEKFSDTLFNLLISETHKNKLLAVVHSETLQDATYAFDHGADILAHGWVDRPISEKQLLDWQSRKFFVIPTLLVHCNVKKQFNPKSYTLSYEAMIAEIGRLHRSGIPILAGSDAPADELNFGTDFYKELELYVQAGLTPLEALQAATKNPAQAFRLKDKGSIKQGGSADFVLVNGDPLADISQLKRIESVWKKGDKIK